MRSDGRIRKGSPRACSTLNRRELLKTSAAAAMAGVASHIPGKLVHASERQQQYGGYTNQLSYQAGEEIMFHISTPARRYDLEIARIGGEREVVWRKLDIQGYQHPSPENASTHGCEWPVSLRLDVPETWRSGYYRVSLRGMDARGSEVTDSMFFVVRSSRPGRTAKILLQLTTNTYNAYNNWGGSSLYGGLPRARRVSFDRPYAGFVEPFGFTARYSGWQRWEEPFVQWAERSGYKVDVAVNSDLEFHPEILKHYRLVLSVGHDEYWSSKMRDHLEAFIVGGGNVAFFSGNTAFWQVRSEDNGRTLVCWKESFKEDPYYKNADYKLLSTMSCNRLIGRPENEMTGVSFAYGGYHRFFDQYPDGAGAYTIHRPNHWIFKGTGLKRGDLLGEQDRIVGYECDGCEFEVRSGLPVPTFGDGTPKSFEILGTAPAGLSKRDRTIEMVNVALYGEEQEKRPARSGAAVLGIYTAGGTVVTSGCTEWAYGLRGQDRRVERITRNILDKLSS